MYRCTSKGHINQYMYQKVKNQAEKFMSNLTGHRCTKILFKKNE